MDELSVRNIIEVKYTNNRIIVSIKGHLITHFTVISNRLKVPIFLGLVAGESLHQQDFIINTTPLSITSLPAK